MLPEQIDLDLGRGRDGFGASAKCLGGFHDYMGHDLGTRQRTISHVVMPGRATSANEASDEYQMMRPSGY